MITFQSISKIYMNNKRANTVLDNINLSVQEHEIFGLVGESGAGKTTLLRLILNLEQPDSGTILIDGKDINDKSHLKTFRNISAAVFQEPNLLSNKTCYENVLLPLTLRGMKDTGQILEYLRFVGLDHYKDHYPATLSGGEKQRLSIARALVTNPKILICDEPTAALDYQSTQNMIKLLSQIQKTYGTTIVLVTHDLDFARAICDTISLLDKGHIVANYAMNQTQETIKPASYKQYVQELFQ